MKGLTKALKIIKKWFKLDSQIIIGIEANPQKCFLKGLKIIWRL